MTGGRSSRDKGGRIEREMVERHKNIGVHAERYPLSGATKFRGSSHDTDIYALGREEAPLVAEVKGRKSGQGFTVLERWLGDYDLMFLRRDRADPLVVMPWRVWERLLTHGKPNPLVDPRLGLYSRNGVGLARSPGDARAAGPGKPVVRSSQGGR